MSAARELRRERRHRATTMLVTFRAWCEGMAEDRTVTADDRDLWATLAQLIADHLERTR